MELICNNLILSFLLLTFCCFGQIWTIHDFGLVPDHQTSNDEDSRNQHQLSSQESFDCSGIKCEENPGNSTTIHCPLDSVRKPLLITSSNDSNSNDNSMLLLNSCCPLPIHKIQNECECNPLHLCPQPHCSGTNLIPKLLKNGTSQPGNCCPTYECGDLMDGTNRNHEEVECIFHGEKFQLGDSWIHNEDCAHCTCGNNGLSSCSPIVCEYPSDCSRVIKPKPSLNSSSSSMASCCPICAECISRSGQVYNDSDVWQEDVCTTCRCNDGRKQCHTMSCHSHCLQPKFIEGACCPVCDINNNNNDLQSNNHHYCPSLPNCIFIECKHGVKLDSRGCPSCECNKCPSLVNCSKSCSSGYRNNEDGCAICSCIESDHDENNNNNKLTNNYFHHHQCDESQKHGDEWFDGCRHCVCVHGVQMCSLLSCPPTSCEAPIFHLGECCPRCKGTRADVTKVNVKSSSNMLNCKSSTNSQADEARRRIHSQDHDSDGDDDEIFPTLNSSTSSCFNCTCHNGQIFCASPDCPSHPIHCNHQHDQDETQSSNSTFSRNECCATCSENKQASMTFHSRTNTNSNNKKSRNCFSVDTRNIYNHGETWKVGECQSCTCSDGQIDCYSSEKCMKPDCENPVFAKFQCCPICLEISDNNVLVIRNPNQAIKSSSSTTTSSSERKLYLQPYCIILIISLLIVTTLFIIFIVRNWILRNHHHGHGGGGSRTRRRRRFKTSCMLHPQQRSSSSPSNTLFSTTSSLSSPPSPPVTPNYNCCYKYYSNCGQLSEQKTPLCSTIPINNTSCTIQSDGGGLQDNNVNTSESIASTLVEKV